MGWGHISVNTDDPFNKRVIFVFNLQTCLIFLTYKGINFYYHFVIIV